MIVSGLRQPGWTDPACGSPEALCSASLAPAGDLARPPTLHQTISDVSALSLTVDTSQIRAKK